VVTTLTQQIKRQARELGFDFVGVTAAGRAQSHARYVDWLARGYHGAMGYLARPDAVARRADVRALLPSVRSVVVVAINYYSPARLCRGQSRRGRRRSLCLGR
jgi:epoxyqueuosine reductase